MPRQTLTRQTPVGPYPALPVVANSLDLVWTAADATNKEQFIPDADNLILVWNTHATTAYTFTITSVVDERNRTGDIGPFTLQAGEIAAYRLQKSGFLQSDGYIYMEANNAAVKYAIIKLSG